MRFESPWMLLLLAAVLLLAWSGRRRRANATIGFPSTDNAVRAGVSLRRRIARLLSGVKLLGLALLVVALARPQKGTEQVRDVSKGIAIEMVVDRSSSMGQELEYEGRTLSRLDAVKATFEKFVFGDGRDLRGRPNDLIGMVAFARYPDTVCPLTLAHGALSQMLGSVKLVRTGGPEDATAIGEAVALAAARLKTAEETIAKQTGESRDKYKIESKIIILLTDGENNAGNRDPMQAAGLAAKWGIKIYAIGVGGDEAVASIQTPFGVFKVPGGHGVNRETLKNMAEQTGGLFRMAGDAGSLRAVYEEIDRLERTEVESVKYMDYRELFTPFALAALALFAAGLVLDSTVFRRIP